MDLFDNAATVESCVWTLKLADFPRARNRALINSINNGAPPYTAQEQAENNASINVNFLESTRMMHDGRRQFMSAFTKPEAYFKVKVDRGPIHKRERYSTIISNNIARIMKRSLPYFERCRSTFGSVVLHGIGPSVWNNKHSWCPEARGIEDVMVPSNTLLSMENMPLYAVYEPYTAMQLRRMTRGKKVDAAWNMDMVNKLIEKLEAQALEYGLPNAEIWSPEKIGERFKEDSGLFAIDSIPTIPTWSFYFHDEEDKTAGWNKRIILDAAWDAMGAGGFDGNAMKSMKDAKSALIDSRGSFLYNPGKRKYASKRSELIHFQFGDLSAVAPFRYHTVRSLGFLLYAICHLQNRLRCAFTEGLFEQMMQYFRVKSMEDVERTLKINLYNRGYVDETTQFIPQSERWQMPEALVQMGLQMNAGLIGQSASIYRGKQDEGNPQAQQTATEVLAKEHSASALVGAALAQAFVYEEFEYMEIARRFSIPNSTDMDVREFRKRCLKEGVPEEILNSSESWEINAERTLGAGNKSVELQVAQMLMGARPMFDPESQRQILKTFTLAVTDDAGMADSLVPDQPNKVTDARHDAQLSMATLMMGLPVDIQKGVNHIETVEALLGGLALEISKIEQASNVPTPQQLEGLMNVSNQISKHIQIIAMDETEKQRVKEYENDLMRLNNLIKAFQQRLQEQMQAAQQQNGNQPDPEIQAKRESLLVTAATKAEISRENHAQKTSQRQAQFELEQKRQARAHEQDLEQKRAEGAVDISTKATLSAIELKKQKEMPAKTVTE